MTAAGVAGWLRKYTNLLALAQLIEDGCLDWADDKLREECEKRQVKLKPPPEEPQPEAV